MKTACPMENNFIKRPPVCLDQCLKLCLLHISTRKNLSYKDHLSIRISVAYIKEKEPLYRDKLSKVHILGSMVDLCMQLFVVQSFQKYKLMQICSKPIG